jgi:NifB/MoaA-like Fe-S oxidoreductase
MFAPILRAKIETLNKAAGTQLKVVGVENNYFGGDVSVAGLLTGGDLLAARDQIAGNFLVIPKATLKSDEDIFLDGMSLPKLAQKLALPVYPVDLVSFASLLIRSDHGTH